MTNTGQPKKNDEQLEIEPVEKMTSKAQRIGTLHLFYATGLVAASVNLFGGFRGVVTALFVGGCWAYIYWWRGVSVLIGIVLLLFCAGLMLPAVSSARSAARRMQCSNNLKQLALALLNYESAYRSFPPAVTYSDSGKPMHSWRTLILPFAEQGQLFKQYRMDEPWDGPNNSKLLKQMPSLFRCPHSDDTGFSSDYCVVLGDEHVFKKNGATKVSEIRDGLSATMLIVEYPAGKIPWMEPREPDLDEYLKYVAAWGPEQPPQHSHSTRFAHCYMGENMAIADGAVHFMPYNVDPSALPAMFNINDGAGYQGDFPILEEKRYSTVRYEGYFAVFAFLLFVILPAFWLRRS